MMYSEKRVPKQFRSPSDPGVLFQKCKEIIDSVLGKKVLTYWEIWGNPNCSQTNLFSVSMANYIFLERERPHLSKNISLSMGTTKVSMYM